MRVFPSHALVADCRKGICCQDLEASVHLTGPPPLSKCGLRPGLQARGVFFNRPYVYLSAPTHSRSLLQLSICSSSSQIALSPSKISPACKVSSPSMQAVRNGPFTSRNPSCASAFVLYRASTNLFSLSKFSSWSCSAMNSSLDNLERIGSGSFSKKSARLFLRNFSTLQITLSRYL
jgi:hypothetical protein